ncbi:hypothetical protein SCLCIDRAFT_308044 [Scleroderma citrinum Foug A]|uniref:Uncharacterized protein n=1 Tax=Scleroderma citrinum Foug A TaxID=1036808 RepID=A0A0C3D3E6_9AGAM|nr:hypothetical protein SCLCIDRAFT_308044 [Scleroderma citrinum Foug A]
MFAGALPVLNILPCRRRLSRFQLAPKLKCANISREAKSFLAFLLRPPWKQVLCRLRNAGSTTTVTETLVSSCSCDTETLIDDTTETSFDLSPRKTVRFDDEPAIFFRSSHVRTPKRSSLKLPERPCLVRVRASLLFGTAD